MPGQVRSRLGIDERLKQPEDRLSVPHHADLGGGGLLDAEDDVRLAVELHGRDDGRAGIGIGLVRDGSAGAGAGLHQDVKPGDRELAERFGYQGDAPLAGRGLLGDADLHGHHLTLSIDEGVRLGTREG